MSMDISKSDYFPLTEIKRSLEESERVSPLEVILLNDDQYNLIGAVVGYPDDSLMHLTDNDVISALGWGKHAESEKEVMWAVVQTQGGFVSGLNLILRTPTV